MKNQNVADISVFESLQADQHAKTGMSQMSVFNWNNVLPPRKAPPEVVSKVKQLVAEFEGIAANAEKLNK
ncbi:MAG: hypothetical protein LBP59_10300, partial [Planctomycetaceae bacterium]|nr:hypothetical protein [Planctomycetaceae bacterium]